MGVEPFIRALEAGAEVIIAGRACDDVIFAALPIMKGFDKGLSLHMGKILECAGLSAIPYDLGEPLVGRVRKDHFVVEPGHGKHRCTTVSVAGHSLYERGDPCIQPGPGGVNDLTHSAFEQLDERSVKVTGRRLRHERCVWMARETTKWPSNRGPITKIMSSDGCKEDAVPLAVG